MRYYAILVLIAMIPLSYAALTIGSNEINGDVIELNPAVVGSSTIISNGTFNQTLTNLLYLQLNGGNSPTADINWGGKSITNLNLLTFSGGSTITQSGADLKMQGDTQIIFATNLYAPSGAINSPSYSFQSFGGNGLYSNNTGMGLVAGGNLRLFLSTSNSPSIVQIPASQTYFASGTFSTPSISFQSSGGTGLYQNVTGLGVSDTGVNVALFDSNGIVQFAPVRITGILRTTAGQNFSGAGGTNTTKLNNWGTLTNVGNINVSNTITSANASAWSTYAVCYLADGTLGHCTSIVGVGGTCTCVSN